MKNKEHEQNARNWDNESGKRIRRNNRTPKQQPTTKKKEQDQEQRTNIKHPNKH